MDKRLPTRKAHLGPRDVEVERRDDGTVVLRSPHPLAPYPDTLTDRLVKWAGECPDRILVAKRDEAGDWMGVTYREAMSRVRALGQALLDRGLSAEKPLAILSGPGIEHFLLILAAQHVGVPYAAISPAYSTVATDFTKLKRAIDLLTPGLVYADDPALYAKAMDAAVPAGTERADFDVMAKTTAGADVERAHAATGPDDIAKFIFTSGSTGLPKAAINPHRLFTSVQQMFVQAMPLFADAPPVVLDWLPWHHSSGGNIIQGLIVYNGGTLYLDDGRPTPELFEKTIVNLREIAPTAYFTVPRAYADLVRYLRDDRELRENFFSRLQMMYYSGASLPAHVWDAMDEIALETCGERIPIISGYGSTETGAFGTCANWEDRSACPVGLPVPGVEIKLVPDGGKLECRLRAPGNAPGYWRNPELSAALYDDEGFLKTGDALAFVDPDAPAKGLEFNGRLAEDFKLSTGTWVDVGPLRERVIEAGKPLIRDVVVAGADRDEIGILIFPDVAQCDELGSEKAGNAFQSMLQKLAQKSTGSSNLITRAIVLDEPPDNVSGEITDKGSINQRAVLDRRAALVDELYAETPSPRVFRLTRTTS